MPFLSSLLWISLKLLPLVKPATKARIHAIIGLHSMAIYESVKRGKDRTNRPEFTSIRHSSDFQTGSFHGDASLLNSGAGKALLFGSETLFRVSLNGGSSLSLSSGQRPKTRLHNQ
jgi:hypothetical protein